MGRDLKSSQNRISIQLTATRRVLMIALIVLQLVFFGWASLLLVNYLFPLHGLINNDYPTLSPDTLPSNPPASTVHCAVNGGLYVLFWVQHIGMASLRYKIAMHKWGETYPLYERYLFNIASGLTLWFIFSHVQPNNDPLFAIPFLLWAPLTLLGVALLAISMGQLGWLILMPHSVESILTHRAITLPPYGHQSEGELSTSGVYGWMRNPMQTGVLLMLVFGGGVYTVERLVFVGVMGGGVYLGVLMEERRMLRQFKGYGEYMGRVRTRLLPYIL